jgi:hypothetical protein
MSQPPAGQPHNPYGNVEHHCNIRDESRATLDADVEQSDAVDIAHEERLWILIESDASHRQNNGKVCGTLKLL